MRGNIVNLSAVYFHALRSLHIYLIKLCFVRLVLSADNYPESAVCWIWANNLHALQSWITDDNNLLTWTQSKNLFLSTSATQYDNCRDHIYLTLHCIKHRIDDFVWCKPNYFSLEPCALCQPSQSWLGRRWTTSTGDSRHLHCDYCITIFITINVCWCLKQGQKIRWIIGQRCHSSCEQIYKYLTSESCLPTDRLAFSIFFRKKSGILRLFVISFCHYQWIFFRRNYSR